MATASVFPRGGAPSRSRLSHTTAGLIAITLAALALRLLTLGEQSYWLDESYTVHLVRLGLGPMLSTIPQTESTPPLYYLLAWAWTHVLGSGESGLRSVSALAGAGTVFVGGLVAERIGGRRAALASAILLAASPLLVWFSQEARAYALASLLTAIALLRLIDYAQTGRRGALAGWAVTAALALATHYFTAFLLLPGASWLLWTGRRRPAVRVAVGGVAVVAIALIPLALAQISTGHADYIANGSLGTRLLQVPKQLLIGYASPAQLLTGCVVLALIVAGVGWPLLRERRRVDTPARLLLASAGVGILLPVGLAAAGIDFLNTRNLLPALVPLVAIATAGFGVPPHPGWSTACAVGVAAVFVAIVALVDTHPAYQRPDWRDAVHALGPTRRPRLVLAAPANAQLPIAAYLPHTHVLATGAASVTEVDVLVVAARPAPATPPGQLPPLPLPDGFRRIANIAGAGYSVQRYRSAAPISVTASQLIGLNVGSSRLVLVQTAPT